MGRIAVPRPPRRWLTRLALPALLLAATATLLAYAARGVLLTGPLVDVAAVVMQPRGAADELQGEPPSGRSEVLAQAPGWVEPAPFATTVTALVEGVLDEVLVLEGDRVERGQVVARLNAQSSRLALRRAELELARREAELVRMQAEAAAAESRAEEVRSELSRQRPLVAAGGSTEAEVVRLERRQVALERDVAAAAAAVDVARADVDIARVVVEEARLAMDRTDVRSPASGTVMRVLAEPGSLVSMSARSAETMPGAILRLYDPEALQVRVDVPLAEAAGVSVGAPVELRCEALPDVVFHGTVRRLVHEANIQRNTVQIKVGLEKPSPVLKPEMLMRAKIFAVAAGSAPSSERDTASTAPGAASRLRLLVPVAALTDRREGAATVWVVEPGTLPDEWFATRREISLALSRSPVDGFAEANTGVNPGDRVIVGPPPTLTSGARVRIAPRSAP